MRGAPLKGATVRNARIILALLGLLALVALSLSSGRAGAIAPGGVEGLTPAPIATPAKIYRECEEIAFCSGCKPRYRCRSCEYKRTCSGGVCSWGDICVWGAYVKVLPPDARIIRRR